MKYFGFYNPYGDMAGFCIPVLTDDSGTLFFQQVVNNFICTFSPAGHLDTTREKDCFGKIKNDLEFKTEHVFDKNHEAFYVFDLYGTILRGDYQLISEILKERINDFSDEPHLLLDVAYFLADKQLVNDAEKMVSDLYQKEFKGYKIHDISQRQMSTFEDDIKKAVTAVEREEISALDLKV